jgi:thiamine pyrophosphate-dependent acetolactate synthase large subunit-like protein
MEFETAEARAATLLKRAERYRRLAAKTVEHDTHARLRRLAEDLEADAAIEMAHAALLRHSHQDNVTKLDMAIAAAGDEETD